MQCETLHSVTSLEIYGVLQNGYIFFGQNVKMEVDEDELLGFDVFSEEDTGANMNFNARKKRKLITVDNSLIEKGSVNTGVEVRINNLIELTSHVIELGPRRLNKPCADMLLMWEANKGNFLVSYCVCVLRFDFNKR